MAVELFALQLILCGLNLTDKNSNDGRGERGHLLGPVLKKEKTDSVSLRRNLVVFSSQKMYGKNLCER